MFWTVCEIKAEDWQYTRDSKDEWNIGPTIVASHDPSALLRRTASSPADSRGRGAEL
jgi:hypothetical protein